MMTCFECFALMIAATATVAMIIVGHVTLMTAKHQPVYKASSPGCKAQCKARHILCEGSMQTQVGERLELHTR